MVESARGATTNACATESGGITDGCRTGRLKNLAIPPLSGASRDGDSLATCLRQSRGVARSIREIWERPMAWWEGPSDKLRSARSTLRPLPSP